MRTTELYGGTQGPEYLEVFCAKEEGSVGMIPGHHFHLSSSFLYILNTLDTFGEILFQKRDMGLKDKAQKHCTLHSRKGGHNIPQSKQDRQMHNKYFK